MSATFLSSVSDASETDVELPYFTPLDDTLIHQVRFITRKRAIHISCICRTRAPSSENSKDGTRSLDSIGPTKSLEESRKLYNDPDNHWAPFTEEDKAKW